jgi:hydrogenase-4 component B
LMKRMPWTGSVMIGGAVAIAALPPMNGFVGKWLMYLGLMNYGLSTSGIRGLAALLAVGLLAFIGGLATLTFVRLIGIVLLGSPRSESASRAHESSPWMLGPMVVLVGLCVIVAVIPQLVVGLLASVLDQLLGPRGADVLLELEASEAPLSILGYLDAWTLGAFGLTAAILLVLTRRMPRAEGPTWGCGYIRPTFRMQYTGSSFAEMLAENLLPGFLRPRTSRNGPNGLFPVSGEFVSECPDPVTENVYEPLFARWAGWFARLRVLQQGKVHVYLVYVMLTVVLALAWVSVRTWWAVR